MHVDLRVADEINFPNGKPEQQAGPFKEPTDAVANFGRYNGRHFSDILVDHFSYYCWAIQQAQPHC
eukprot:12713353-Alexandrium_andersonii.AAC.1